MARLRYNLDDIPEYGIKPGDYVMKITKVEQTLSSKKKPMIVWYWEITSPGSEKGKKIKSYASQEPNALQNMRMHLEALQFSGDVDVSLAKLVGMKAVGSIASKIFVNDDGKERKVSNVINLSPYAKQKPLLDLEDDYDEDDEDYEDEDYEDEDYEDEDEEPAPPPRRRKKVVKKRSTSRRPRRQRDYEEEDEDDIPF